MLPKCRASLEKQRKVESGWRDGMQLEMAMKSRRP
jgi:hypothetical protein